MAKARLLEPLRRVYRGIRLAARAGRLVREARSAAGHGAWFDLVCRFDDFRPLQVRTEIVALLERVEALRPARICEIGPYLGGTSFLFARAAAPRATIVLVDYQMSTARIRALRRLGLPGQRIKCVEGDSHDPRIRAEVAACLGGEPVDFLFIDGDHRYEGVAADWRDYAPLVKPGGLVAFHDVVLDHRARFGRDTTADSGGVPRFWGELKARYGGAASEWVASPDQDGCGIGMISVGTAGAPPPGA